MEVIRLGTHTFYVFLIILCSLAVVTKVSAAAVEKKDQKLLILMIDSLRHDFLKPPRIGDFPSLGRLVREGSRADRLVPVFPALTLPNFLSLLSGMNTEEHSFTDNLLYDSSTGKKFTGTFTGDDWNPQWWSQETIIDTAEKQKQKTYSYNTPMCRSPPATFCDADSDLYGMTIFEKQLHNASEALKADADLAMVYVPQPDTTMHFRDVLDPAVITTVQAIDKIIGNFLEGIKDHELKDKLNIIVISDHGHITVQKENVFYWGSAVDRDDFDEILINPGTVIQLWPKQGKENQVVEKLKSSDGPITVYRRHEIPDAWHMKHGKWVPPVYVTTDFGKVFIENDTSITFGDATKVGYHGYHIDHPDISGVCLAWGPAFKKGHSLGAVTATDVYQLFTAVLDINPHPHNGSWERVQDMFASSSANQLHFWITNVAISALIWFYLY